jgi:hypothetical protein
VCFVVSNGGAYENGGTGPLQYAELNMNLENGLGAVNADVKNVLLNIGEKYHNKRFNRYAKCQWNRF